MIHANMQRIYQNENGSGSVITFKKGAGLDLELFIVERPWLDNQVNVSCIPAGAYIVKLRDGSNTNLRFPDAWEVTNVQGRSGIVFHIANRPGELHGCLAPNLELRLKEFGDIQGVNSAHAMKKMNLFLQGETEFILKIE